MIKAWPRVAKVWRTWGQVCRDGRGGGSGAWSVKAGIRVMRRRRGCGRRGQVCSGGGVGVEARVGYGGLDEGADFGSGRV